MNIKVKITRQENAKYFNCELNSIIEVPFEEYVAAVVASEIGNSNLNACCAQAIAARTYAINAGVLRGKVITDDSSTAQAYRAPRYNAKLYPNCIMAANKTIGQILTYKEKPISAVYSSCNGGHTVSSKERWGGTRPYLISQDDPWDAATGKKKHGHGVGMSQVGAIWAGAHNITYIDILDFYYPNTHLCGNYGNKEIIKIEIKQLMQLHEQIASIQDQLNKIKEEL